MTTTLRCLALVLAAALTTVGCEDDAPPASGPDYSNLRPSAQSSPTTTPPTATAANVDPAARRALKAAQRGLLRRDTGAILSRTTVGATQLKTEGVYQLSTLSHRTTSVLVSPEGRIEVEVIAIGERVWFRLVDVTRSGGEGPNVDRDLTLCWTAGDVAALRAVYGEPPTESDEGSIVGLPSSLVVAADATGMRLLSDGRIIGRSDMYSIAASMNGRTPGILGIDADETADAPLVLDIDDGVVSGWSSSLTDVLRAAEDAGIDLSPIAQLALTQSGNGRLVTELTAVDEPVSISAPPADATVEFTSDEDELDRQMAACGARQR